MLKGGLHAAGNSSSLDKLLNVLANKEAASELKKLQAEIKKLQAIKKEVLDS